LRVENDALKWRKTMPYTCAVCAKTSCRNEDKSDMPANCPMHDQATLEKSLDAYASEGLVPFFKASAEIEAEGYCEWPRVRETINFCKKMGYKRLGIAFCLGLKQEAKIYEGMLRREGFEVHSVICKTGGIPKEHMGLSDSQKVRPGTYETMCNPIAQAFYLNEMATDFNIVIGLCVGHDSLFYKHSDAMVTTLIAKDRVLAHNPAGALYCAESYYKNK
jgi:uncharacterized metal-binding protein